MTASAIYTGHIHHRRLRPRGHAFSYPVLFLLLDLDELTGAFEAHPLFSSRPRAPIGFDRRDHLYDPARPLADEARELVERATSGRPEGPVRLLTMPRMLGFGYNPVSFFYLYDPHGETVQALMAEVTNTPWRERAHYVLEREPGSERIEGRSEKRLHVSPFMAMDQVYEWRADQPGERLEIEIANIEASERVFEARLALDRRSLTRKQMTRALLRYPPQTLAALARIYWNAARLRLLGLPLLPRPAGGSR
ncbi:MAG TPA: DUF1365 domain-containing protein [Solirubrobacterales bacterium]